MGKAIFFLFEKNGLFYLKGPFHRLWHGACLIGNLPCFTVSLSLFCPPASTDLLRECPVFYNKQNTIKQETKNLSGEKKGKERKIERKRKRNEKQGKKKEKKVFMHISFCPFCLSCACSYFCLFFLFLFFQRAIYGIRSSFSVFDLLFYHVTTEGRPTRDGRKKRLCVFCFLLFFYLILYFSYLLLVSFPLIVNKLVANEVDLKAYLNERSMGYDNILIETYFCQRIELTCGRSMIF